MVIFLLCKSGHRMKLIVVRVLGARVLHIEVVEPSNHRGYKGAVFAWKHVTVSSAGSVDEEGSYLGIRPAH